MAKIIGICNQKGGTGKTTTAVNLSVFLGLAKKKVLLVDMDPQGNTSSALLSSENNNSPAKTNIYHLLIESQENKINQALETTKIPTVFVIASDVSLTGAEIELVNIEQREYRLKQAIAPVKDQFDYIIIDAPPSLGLLTINVLAAADSVLIPIQCEYYALEGLSKLLQTIELVKEGLNSTLDIEGILLTMADFRTRLTMQVINEVKKFFPDKTFKTIIPRNVKLAEAPSFSQPVYFYDDRCVGAKAYFNLAEEILKEKIKGVYDGKKSSWPGTGSVDSQKEEQTAVYYG